MARIERARGQPEEHRGRNHEPGPLGQEEVQDGPRRQQSVSGAAPAVELDAAPRGPRRTSRPAAAGAGERQAGEHEQRVRLGRPRRSAVVPSRAELPEDVSHARFFGVDEPHERLAGQVAIEPAVARRAPRASPGTPTIAAIERFEALRGPDR